ncbi:Williams Beuren syndrome chromosome region 22 protein [Chytriomyces hyalinus]|nr:Williams Beuren syndrome chromosome region 22 protein [Chytriomyces hyalinus]KAJ3263787.1 Williams Beuren syndrome chromosome region 22 protein [Chytriomyces hyalinus]
MSASRPEHIAPPEIFYNETEAGKYTDNSRITAIQYDMTQRALELMCLPEEPQLLLDIGCGSGLSGECLDEQGHHWVGMDVSPAMLAVANERDVEGDLFLQDIGQGVGYRPGSFDGAISISVIQWLCNADKSHHVPKKRLLRFFSTLYTALARGARAVFQFYPEGPQQVEMIMAAAMRAGFTGGLVVDYPNSSKAKKYFLCLFAGYAGNQRASPELPKGLDGDGPQSVEYAGKRQREDRKRKGKLVSAKGKDWVLHKKELNRMRGKAHVPVDTKYTARKRKIRF